ncbi:hypothetical protein HELRODRAFT_164840 [Helobdella robusta]|uniref:BACK domain-containing protein n=1 Tax=Helobdella robusta TaxID=6412 RepID=T1EVV4_HELRO|nr:hypothetical protein HELRODRAFT_164840 [Helobdella robusta]ESN92741.1 hypothetical protein HELRODRAFT_164840 [Helobdella robusta]
MDRTEQCKGNQRRGAENSEEIVLISKTGGRYKVDKLLFKQASAYYRALVNSGMKDANVHELTLECLSDGCLDKVVDYLSKQQADNEKIENQSVKSFEEIDEGLEGATYLQISEMMDRYFKFLSKYPLNDTTWLHILNLANKYSMKGLIKKIMNFICDNFNSLVNHADLMTLSLEEMNHFVKSEEINADGEFQIFNFIVKWLSVGVDQSRMRHAEKLLDEVRFGLMTTAEKQKSRDVIEKLNLNVRQTERNMKCRRVERVCLAFLEEYEKIHLKVLHLADVKSGIGLSLPQTNDYNAFKFNDERARPNTHPIMCSSFETCVLDNCLYVAGGVSLKSSSYQVLDNVYVYDPIHSVWSQRSNMLSPKCNFYFGEMDGELYTVAGVNMDFSALGSTTIEKYVPKEDRWYQMSSRQPVQLENFSTCCVFNGKIYMSGGLDAEGEIIKSVYKYDPATEEWHSVTPLLTGRCSHIMAPYANKLFAIGGINYNFIDRSRHIMVNIVASFFTLTHFRSRLRIFNNFV